MSDKDAKSREVIIFKQVKSGQLKSIRSFIRQKWVVLLIVMIIGVIAVLAYGYITTKNQLNRLANTEKVGQTEIQQITNKVSKAIQLPTESATLATVTDANKLKGQTFFKNAQNGDKVLIYSDSGRALLYRPSTEKVIEYTLVDFSDSPQ